VGEFQRSIAELWPIVFQSASLLTVPLTVAVHRIKKPFVYAGFDNLNTDGHGFSLVLRNEQTGDHQGGEWRASSQVGGSPGEPDPPPPDLPPVLVNEALTHAEPPYEDVVELFNPSSKTADVSGWYLTDDFNHPRKFRFPDGAMILPGSFLALDEHAFNPSGDPFGSEGFSFGADGDEIYLFSGNDAGELTGYAHGFKFGAAEANVAFGRYVDSLGREQFVPQTARSFFGPNPGPKVGPVVISEIMWHPPPAEGCGCGRLTKTPQFEFIELRNITDQPVALFYTNFQATNAWLGTNTWRLRGEGWTGFTFPPGLILPPQEYLLVVNFDPGSETVTMQTFRARYGLAATVPMVGPYQPSLSSARDGLELAKPGWLAGGDSSEGDVMVLVTLDRVEFGGRIPWPLAADGWGASLQRIDLAGFGNDPVNWTGAFPTPGSSNRMGTGPFIVSQPTDWSGLISTTVKLTVGAQGSSPLRYQWQLSSTNIPCATSETLLLNNVQPWQAGSYRVVVMDDAGSTASSYAQVAVLIPASIIKQPVSQSVESGAEVTFQVLASSNSSIVYQWRKNDRDIPGATGPSLTLTNLQEADEAIYDVLVTDAIGMLVSAPARLYVLAAPMPLLVPLSQSVVEGGSVTFSIETKGTLPMSYRWRKGSETVTNMILDSHQAFFTLQNARAIDAGSYSVVLTNAVSFQPGILVTGFSLIVLADTDKDGLPDDYETPERGLNPNDPSDALLDSDGDGMTNGAEYRAGTDPRDALSYLRIDRLTVADGSGLATLEFLAYSNVTYTVQASDDFNRFPWSRVADIVAASTNRWVTIRDLRPIPPEGERFYRLVIPRSP
jgi:Lamin Tail Domain/Bacterial TSP3 repeat/Immunoglobulin I-set domain